MGGNEGRLRKPLVGDWIDLSDRISPLLLDIANYRGLRKDAAAIVWLKR